MLDILIVDSSHLARLEASEISLAIRQRLHFHCVGGARLGFLRSVMDDVERERIPRPSIALFFLGGNDIDNYRSEPESLAREYAAIYNRLSIIGTIVMIMRQWPRPGARIGAERYWQKVQVFEHHLENLIDRNCWIWAWDRTLRFNGSFFKQDGVHCRETKYKKVARYIRSPLLFAIKRLGH